VNKQIDECKDVDGISPLVLRKNGEFGSPTRCWDDIIKTAIGLRFGEEHTVQRCYEIKGKIKDL
jgi:hypothetical protein